MEFDVSGRNSGRVVTPRVALVSRVGGGQISGAMGARTGPGSYTRSGN
jgi:hypothetical protein